MSNNFTTLTPEQEALLPTIQRALQQAVKVASDDAAKAAIGSVFHIAGQLQLDQDNVRSENPSGVPMVVLPISMIGIDGSVVEVRMEKFDALNLITKIAKALRDLGEMEGG